MSIQINTKLLGEALKKKRKEAGFSQIALSNMIGISRSYLADTEAGRQSLSLKVLIKWLDVLSTDLSYLANLNLLEESEKDRRLKRTDLLTESELMYLTKVSPKTIRLWRNEGMPFIASDNGQMLYNRKDVTAWLNEHNIVLKNTLAYLKNEEDDVKP